MTAPIIGLVWVVVALPLLGAVLNGLIAVLRPQAKSAVSVIGPGVLVGAFIMAAAVVVGLAGLPPDAPQVVRIWPWLVAGRLDVDIAFLVDRLSAVMLLVVTGIGSLIHIFSIGYMRSDEGYARYFAYLNLFVVFMLVLVLGSNMPVVFIGWEGVGLASYLLIGFWFSDEQNAAAGKKAFLVNRIGDFGFLVAMFLVWNHVGALDFSTVLGAPWVPGGALVTAVTLFLFLGCAGKSAQIPLYVWLPDAMAGPTPVSALIHAATMVTAGVYLVARTGLLFAAAPLSSAVVAGIGALTALFAATIGLRQYDIKKVLAYSTVSQLGYMFVGVGAGAYAAGIFHLVTHAFFKALLFLGAGSVIHAMHHAYHATHSHDDAQDMRNMGGLRRYLPVTWVLMWIATLAIAGVPPFSGFFSKDEILGAAFARGAAGQPIYYVFYAMLVVAAFITAYYMARLMAMTFHGASRATAAEREQLHEAPWSMTGPLIVLGIGSAVAGVLNLPTLVGGHAWLEHWLEPVTGIATRLSGFRPVAGNHEAVLVGLAVLVGVAGLIAGFRATTARALVPAREAAPDTGLARLVYHKFYVDELYERFIVRPIVTFSRVFLWRIFDQGVVDGVAVNGSARLFRGIGWLGSRLQSGQVGLYIVVFVVGAIWILRTILG